MLSNQNALLSRPDHHNSTYFPLLSQQELTLQDCKAFMPYELFPPLDESPEED